MKSQLKILHLEDSAADCQIISRILTVDGIDADITRCENRDKFVEAIQGEKFDLIFADCTLPQFSGLHALEIARKSAPETPFIFVSGTLNEDTAIESLRSGATDYVLKDRLSRLVPAVRRAIAEREERAKNQEMEKKLRMAQRLESVGTLAGGIAHDFNNILTIIRSYTSLLPQESSDPARVREIAAVIDGASSRGAELVSELMALARKTEGNLVPLDLVQRVKESVAMLRPTMPPNIAFELKLAENLPAIYGDSGQIDRVLLNLVSNSRDAMPGGGTITFSIDRVRYEETPPGPVPRNATNYYLRLRIRDTGSGMDESTRQRVFEPFFTTKPLGKGTGLGMAVVYGLMQSHDGLIDVQSSLGEGTAVSLYFPVPEAPAMASATTPQKKEVSLDGTETVLLVDDEADMRYFVEMMLNLHGYKVIAAADGEMALEAMLSTPGGINVLFSDVGLPLMDGFELTRRVRAVNPNVRAILSTGYADSKFKAKMKAEAIDGYIPKPYDAVSLLTIIRATLDNEPVSPVPPVPR